MLDQVGEVSEMVTATARTGESGRRERRRTRRKRLRRVSFIVVLSVCVGIVLLPVYWILLSAFVPQDVLFSGHFDFLPTRLTLANFQIAFSAVPVWSEFLHSVVLAIVPASIATLIGFPAAYAFRRLNLRGGPALLGFIVFSGFLPVTTTVIPLYELFKSVGLVGSWAGLIIIYTAFQLGFTAWILSTFMARIPRELDEAGRVDGASRLQIMVHVMWPIMVPATASLFIVNFLSGWNQFLLPTVFSTTDATTPLVMGLAQAGIDPVTQSVVWGAQAAFGLFVVVPPIAVVLIFQRRIVAGLTAGAIKG